MRPEQILTKSEYVYSRKTTLDHILFYSWVPFFVIFGLLSIAIFNNSSEGMRFFGFLEVPSLMLTIICRNIYAKKEAEYIMDYYNIYLPSTKQ